jgi:hypothetical protein
MTIKTLGIMTAVAVVGVLVYVASLIVAPWETQTIGSYTIRRNKLSGLAEVRVGERWTRFEDDLYAEPLHPEILKRLRVSEVVWGKDGILCGTVNNRLANPVKGRLAFRIVIRNKKDLRYIRDRSLRATVDFPAGSTTPFILRTGLSTPDIATTLTEVEIQPASFSGH